ncbi:hypothetical protein ACSFB8_09865 [Enterococcus faecalis]
MEQKVKVMTFAQLKKMVQMLEDNSQVTDQTKVFIDTGWDSVQEVDPEAILVENVMKFKVLDALTQDQFIGYSLLEKAEKMAADGEPEAAIIIRNLY